MLIYNSKKGQILKIIKNKIQAGYLIASSVILLFQILFFYSFSSQKNMVFFLVLPLLLLCIIFGIENLVKKENSTLRFVLILFSTFIILFFQLCLCTTILLTNMDNNIKIQTQINDLKEYSRTIKNVRSHITMHFPISIPRDAKNAMFYCSRDSYFGGRIIYLKFSTSDNYIKSEINKYKYLFTEGPYANLRQYGESYARSFIFNKNNTIIGYEIYIIGNNSNTKNCHDSCEYGIAINKKANTIIYYASNPD